MSELELLNDVNVPFPSGAASSCRTICVRFVPSPWNMPVSPMPPVVAAILLLNAACPKFPDPTRWRPLLSRRQTAFDHPAQQQEKTMNQAITFGRVVPTFPVTDVDESSAYYLDKLGFEETMRDGDCYAHLKRGDAVIALYRFLSYRNGQVAKISGRHRNKDDYFRSRHQRAAPRIYRAKGVKVLIHRRKFPTARTCRFLIATATSLSLLTLAPNNSEIIHVRPRDA